MFFICFEAIEAAQNYNLRAQVTAFEAKAVTYDIALQSIKY